MNAYTTQAHSASGWSIRLLTALIAALISLPALAQSTRFVSTTGTNSNPASATSWATSTTDVQGAIDAATTGDQVWIAQGLYKPASSLQMKNGVAIYGGFVGSETALTGRPAINPITGNPSSTTLSGDNARRVFDHPSSLSLTNSAVLDGVVITGGRSDQGGGMRNEGNTGTPADPSLRNCSFTGNQTTGGAFSEGGAMFNLNSNPSLTNCSFQSNTATGGSNGNSGGAMFNLNSNPNLTNCSFQGNQTTGGTVSDGGAMFNNNSNPSLRNCSFLNNQATGGSTNQGGAMFNLNSNPSLTNCSFQSNTATGGTISQGGAMVNLDSSNPSLTNCILWNNAGGNSFVNINGGTVTARYSLFDNTTNVDVTGPGNLTTNTSPFVSASSVALAPGSLAIDAGLSSASGLIGVTTDLAGNPRVMGCRVDMGAVEFVNNTDGLPTVFITLPNGSTVSVAGNLPTLTLPPNGPLVLQASGGTAYERVVILDRLNGYEIRQVDQNTTGLFPITTPGLFTLTVTGANGCSRTVQGVVVRL